MIHGHGIETNLPEWKGSVSELELILWVNGFLFKCCNDRYMESINTVSPFFISRPSNSLPALGPRNKRTSIHFPIVFSKVGRHNHNALAHSIGFPSSP